MQVVDLFLSIFGFTFLSLLATWAHIKIEEKIDRASKSYIFLTYLAPVTIVVVPAIIALAILPS